MFQIKNIIKPIIILGLVAIIANGVKVEKSFFNALVLNAEKKVEWAIKYKTKRKTYNVELSAISGYDTELYTTEDIKIASDPMKYFNEEVTIKRYKVYWYGKFIKSYSDVVDYAPKNKVMDIIPSKDELPELQGKERRDYIQKRIDKFNKELENKFS